jgi:hypothetical protein
MTDTLFRRGDTADHTVFLFTAVGRGGRVGGADRPVTGERTKMSEWCARVSGTGTEGGTPLSPDHGWNRGGPDGR